MKKFLFLIMVLLIAGVGYSATINTWFGTGFHPFAKVDWPERDTGANWKLISNSFPLSQSESCTQIVFSNKILVFDRTSVLASSDGVNWPYLSNTIPISFTQHNNPGEYNSKIWGITGKSVYYSPDGVTWTLATNTAAFPGGGTVCAFNGVLIAASSSNVWESIDGISWSALTTNAAFGALTRPRMVTWNNKLYIHAGMNPYLWVSSDGISWNQIVYSGIPTSGNNAAFAIFVYNNKLYCSGYNNGNYGCMSTSDGVVWSNASIPQTYPIGSVKGHMYGIYGPSNTTYRSY